MLKQYTKSAPSIQREFQFHFSFILQKKNFIIIFLRMIQKIFYTAFLFLFSLSIIFCQPQNDSLSSSNTKKQWITYGLIGYSAASFYVEYKWWWEGNYHPFKFENDGFWNNYSLGVDKFGHFYISYLYFNLTYEILRWADYDKETALWIAFAIPAFNALSIEIGDGFSTYAFSATDFTFNMAGIGYGIAQREIPFLQNFKFKWSYYPSGNIPFDDGFRISDDYDGHIYWLSVNVHNLLPESAQSWWPRFLSIAVGYGGKNIYGRPAWVGDPIGAAGKPERKWAVSLDYNVSEIPLNGGLWNTFKSILDNFKFPAPGIKKTGNSSVEVKPLLFN